MNLKRHLILLKELFPFTFVVILWLVQLWQGFTGEDWSHWAVYPRTVSGLTGILFSPVLHAGFEHLAGNTVPLIVLGFILFNAYREIAGKVFWIVYFLNGTLIWLFAREAFHLGASGVVYGVAFFLFFSGFIRKVPRLTMISFLLIFLYGSMVWGVFPFDPQVSWEAHLYGALSGLVLAFVLRKQGPQPAKYFEDEEETDENVTDLTKEEEALLTEEQIVRLRETQTENSRQEPVIRVLYEYKERTDEEKKD